MKALFLGVVTLFLIVGMSNDAQAQARPLAQPPKATSVTGLQPTDYADKLPCGREARERFYDIHGRRVMSYVQSDRWRARCGYGCGSGFAAGGHCYGWGGRGSEGW
jgi:hypothetical protein